ncbi:MAG TPA: circadian clock protein KaiC [Blastocatellia bacterium]|nr:circadian clock protein KaiC [Blastocatellia bacterium]
MSRARHKASGSLEPVQKSPTGIQGLDEITRGGLPKGRPTLFCGSAGCGKTLFATEFLVRGATQYDEPGVFMSFEETGEELTKNVASLGFDLKNLIATKKLVIDHVQVERSEIEETGEYDLEAIFIRLGYAIDSIGAKRVVMDTLESLFAALPNEAILRAELRRLFGWLKTRGMTAVITAERGAGTLTRHGLEEYVSDCVILLDHRVTDLVSTRRLRVVKYRGSTHGTNEYPFLIDEQGISVLPITSIGLNHQVSNERVPSGIPRLDTMLGGEGFYRGSSVLVSGTPGTGKSSMAAHFADASCSRGERCIYFAFEESEQQIIRNMRSIGIDLGRWVKRGLLRFHATRPTAQGLEMHLVTMNKQINEFRPSAAIVDPVTNLISTGTAKEVESTLTRLIDFLKGHGITLFFTSLTHGNLNLERSEVGMSSLMDTWILLRDIESNGERNRGIYILKSRGMAHSNQIREFKLSDTGVHLSDVYLGSAGVLTGSARAAQEAKEAFEARARRQEIDRKERALVRKRRALEAQISALRDEFEAEEEEIRTIVAQEETLEVSIDDQRREMAQVRKADDGALKPVERDARRNQAIRINGKRRAR